MPPCHNLLIDLCRLLFQRFLLPPAQPTAHVSLDLWLFADGFNLTSRPDVHFRVSLVDLSGTIFAAEGLPVGYSRALNCKYVCLEQGSQI